jgi:hypothetical protein
MSPEISTQSEHIRDVGVGRERQNSSEIHRQPFQNWRDEYSDNPFGIRSDAVGASDATVSERRPEIARTSLRYMRYCTILRE